MKQPAFDYSKPVLYNRAAVNRARRSLLTEHAVLSACTTCHLPTPITLHYLFAHFGGSIHNFYRSESQLGRPNHYIEGMAANGAPEVRKGMLKLPTTPGLGLEINPDFLKKNLAPGEEYWE